MVQPQSGFPFDLRTLVAFEAWRNPRIKTQLKENPKAAVAEIAKKHGLNLPDVNFNVIFEEPGNYTLVIPENPVGKSPAEIRAMRSRNSSELKSWSEGMHCSFTAECFCVGTQTGGCSCDTIAGTVCEDGPNYTKPWYCI